MYIYTYICVYVCIHLIVYTSLCIYICIYVYMYMYVYLFWVSDCILHPCTGVYVALHLDKSSRVNLVLRCRRYVLRLRMGRRAGMGLFSVQFENDDVKMSIFLSKPGVLRV